MKDPDAGGCIGVPLLEWYGMTRHQRDDLEGPDSPGCIDGSGRPRIRRAMEKTRRGGEEARAEAGRQRARAACRMKRPYRAPGRGWVAFPGLRPGLE